MHRFPHCAAAAAILALVLSAGPAHGSLTPEELKPILLKEQARDLTDGTLLELARDPKPEIRARVMTALARIQSSEGLDAAVEALEDSDPKVRAKAIFAIGQIGDPRAAAVLTTALDHEPVLENRGLMLEALGRCGSDEDVATLLDVRDTDPELAPSAARGLIYMASRGVNVCSDPARLWQPLIRVKSEEVAWLTGTLISRSKCRNPSAELDRTLKSKNPLVRKSAVRALGATLRSDAAKDISFLLYDEDWRVRWNAVRSLSDLRAEREAGLTSLILDDPNPMLALATAEALGGFGGFGFSRLREWEGTSDWRMRSAYLKAYVRSSADAALIDLHEDSKNSDWHIRLAVAQALGGLDSEQGLFILEHMVNDDVPAVAAAAVNSLIGYPQTEAANMIRPALKSEDPVVVTVAADGVGQRLNRSALSELLTAYEPLQSPVDYEPMVAILEAVGQIIPAGDEQGAIGEFSQNDKARAIALLEEASNDSSTRVANRAAQSLALIRGEETATKEPLPFVPAEFDLELASTLELHEGPLSAAIVTNKGTVVIQLLPQAAPGTVANFVSLARDGYYNGLIFHRVVADFVIQGGDPRGDGWGGPSYEIRCEYNELPYMTGTVGMATSGKDTAGSQFFITHSPQPHLNGRYTVFGQVLKGQEIVDTILQGDKIEEIVIEGL